VDDAPISSDGNREDKAEEKRLSFLDMASDSNDQGAIILIDQTKEMDEEYRTEYLKAMLTFQDSDCNTGLHFGAKNGNFNLCDKIIKEADLIGIADLIVNCRNEEGITPLVLVSWRGYHTVGDKDEAIDRRAPIIELLLKAGAKPNYCKLTTKMTALHWLAFNNDHTAVEMILRNGGDHLAKNSEGLLPIDVAGTTPSLKTVDTLLEHYSATNKLPPPRTFHNDFSTVEKFMDYETESIDGKGKRARAGNYVTKGEQDLEVDFDQDEGEEIGF